MEILDLAPATTGVLRQILKLMQQKEKRAIKVKELEDHFRRDKILAALKKGKQENLIEFINIKDTNKMCRNMLWNRSKRQQGKGVAEQDKPKISLTDEGIYYTEGLFNPQEEVNIKSLELEN